jgi:hypothetical protein
MNMLNKFDYNNLFEMSDPLANRPLRLDPQQNWIDQEMVNNLFYGLAQPPEPIKFIPQSGKQATDVLWSSYPPLFCISQKVVDIFLKNKFTGWGTYPVEVYDHNHNFLPEYYGFSIKSYAGKRDCSRSTRVMKPPVPGLKPSGVYIGTYFDESMWDGSDIFRIQHAVKIVTKAVVQIFKQNKITNVRFTPLLETEISEAIVNFKKYKDNK